MVGPHGDFVAHFGPPGPVRVWQQRFTQVHAARVARTQQQRLVIAAGEIDAVFFVNFALDPVDGFAQVVDAVDGVCFERERESEQVPVEVPVILEAEAFGSGQLVRGDGDEARADGSSSREATSRTSRPAQVEPEDSTLFEYATEPYCPVCEEVFQQCSLRTSSVAGVAAGCVPV